MTADRNVKAATSGHSFGKARARALAMQSVVAGLLGGLLLFAVEAIDRLAVLWPSFHSLAEAAVYTAYLAPSILAGVVLSVVTGAVLGLCRLLAHAAGVAAGRKLPRHASLAGAFVAVVAIGLLLRAASWVAPHMAEVPLQRVVQKIDDRLVSIPTVVDHYSSLVIVGCLAVAAAAVLLSILWTSSERWTVRALQIGIGLVALAGMAVLYAVDSRYYFGRYEWTIHLPASIAQFVLAIVGMGLVWAGARGVIASPRMPVLIVAVLLVCACVTIFDAIHLGTNENLKALLWRRSVVAKRAYEAVAYVTDRDRDGFTSMFAGGDTDNADPAVHPMANEIPDNGIDDNCFGGDASAGQVRAWVSGNLTTAGELDKGMARDFLLVSIDTLRADRMSAYGYDRNTSPCLAGWGNRGVVYSRAYSQGSNTGLSFASMQTSVMRAELFADSRPTMFGRLSAGGYRTAFINARRDDVWLETKRWRKYRKIILDGVSAIDHTQAEPLWDADRVTDRAIEYLSGLDSSAPHATWVHYLDPHEPRKKMAPFDFGNSVSDKYDSEVAFADREVGRLLDWLESTGRLDDTLVVLVADHGEGFQDHGMDLHGNRPYDDQIHVPLMIWAPGVAPARVSEAVAVADIAPTVLSYLGLPPLPDVQGREILRTAASARPIYSETPINLVEVSFFSYAVTYGDWRYIWDIRGNTVELYDLANDPRELTNLADWNPAKRDEMERLLAAWLDSTESVRTLKEM